GEPLALGTGHLRDRGRVVALAFTKDGARVLSGDADGGFTVREAATRKIVFSYSPVGSDARSFPAFAFAPSGEKVFVASSGDNAVLVRDARTGALAAKFEKLEAGVRQLALSPD